MNQVQICLKIISTNDQIRKNKLQIIKVSNPHSQKNPNLNNKKGNGLLL